MTHQKVKLGLLAVLGTFGLSVARADYTVDQSMTLTGDLNWQYNGTITIPAGVTIDLAGHKLSVGVLAGSGEITDTSASSGGDPGELHIVVPAGCTYGNSSVVISGNLKLVKDGAGTYAPTVDYYNTYRDKNYTGGTVVADGTFKAKTLYYPWEPGVTVDAGAVLDINSYWDAGGNAEIPGWYTLNGGTIVNAGYAFPEPAKFADLMHNLRLTADSCLDVKKDFGMRNAGGSAETFIDLGGHVLDIQIASGCNFNLANCTISSGTVKTGGGGGALKFWTSASRLTDVTLDLDSPLETEIDVTVKNLTVRYGGTQSWWGTYYASVSGVYTPISDHIARFKLLNGSTINLSDRTTVFPVASSSKNTKSFAFENNAVITIDLSGRVLSDGEQVMSWSSLPAATFILDDVSAITYDLVVNSSGVFVAHKANYVKTAVWTGAGDKDNPTDPNNWSCTDVSEQSISGCPCVLTEITVETPVTMNVPAGKKVYCKSITTTGTAALASDCDWRGFVKPTIAGTFDLAGHTLRINALRGNGEITDTSSGEPGELHVDVPSGVTAQNTSIVVSGNLKLVKDGEGSLALAKDGQSYTGGTDVNEGTLVYGTGSNPAGVKNSTVKVAAGATLNMNGVLDTSSCIYNYDLAGTVLQFASGNGWGDECRCFGDITLSGDATIYGSNFYFANPTKTTGLITFNGHKLTLNIGNANGIGGYISFGAWNDEAEGGTLEVTGTGQVELAYKVSIGCTRTRFVVTSDTFKIMDDSYIWGWFEYGSDAWASHRGTPVFHVYGRYVALGAIRPRLKMYGGSTLDLSAMDVVWSADGEAPSGLTGDGKVYRNIPGLVSFVANGDAPIFVDLGQRRVQTGDKVVSWSAGAKPPAGVKFRSAPGTNCGFVAKDDGLYVVKGMIIFFR